MKNYIVFDLEWNQSPDGKECSNDKIPFEIIEIGAVKLDKKLRVVSEFHKMVKPEIYQEMHFKISEVTHMNMEELMSQGEAFPGAAAEFIEWCGEDYVFCTWGSMDLTELQKNMAYYGVPNPFPWPLLYYDIQKLYSLLYGDGKMKSSLDMAAAELNILEERPFHRALDDAYYTGKIMGTMRFGDIKDYLSLDYYRVPQTKEEEIYMVFPSYSKYVSRTFETKEDAIADKAVTDMICYRCKRMLRKKVRWFSSNQKFYFGLAACPDHGFLKGKIRIKKTQDGKVFAVKTLKLVGDDGADLIYKKKEEIRKRRNEKNRQKRRSNSKNRETDK